MRIVYIEWRDADGTRGPYSRQAAMSQPGLIMSSVGILVGEDEQVIKLSQDYWKRYDEDGTTPELFREIETIPKVLIRRREDWDVGEGQIIRRHFSTMIAAPCGYSLDTNGVPRLIEEISKVQDATPGPNLPKAEFGCIPDPEAARDPVAFLRSVHGVESKRKG